MGGGWVGARFAFWWPGFTRRYWKPRGKAGSLPWVSLALKGPGLEAMFPEKGLAGRGWRLRNGRRGLNKAGLLRLHFQT